jgi:hypothetical protein
MSKVKIAGMTLGKAGLEVVYQCEECGYRSLMLPMPCKCVERAAINEHHREEMERGIL